jgi:hypothetical protein
MKILFLFLLSFSLQAAPTKIEIWFLSAQKKAELIRSLDLENKIKHSKPIVQNALACERFGEYCFDPQIGLYKKDEAGIKFDVPANATDEALPQLPVAKSVDRSMIDCDKNNAFDIFCGSAKPVVALNKPKFELWIDTSSSMKEMDFSDDQGSCARLRLVQKLDRVCPFQKNVNVMMFDTSIKQVGTMESVCENRGLNDYKKLLDWVERSDATSLVIITDIYEFFKEVSDYVESKKGKIRGDKDPLTSKDLEGLSDNLAKLCK